MSKRSGNLLLLCWICELLAGSMYFLEVCVLGQAETTEVHVIGSDLRGYELLEPLSEQSLCKSKSGVSALVTWELSQGNIGFVQLGEMIRSGSQWHGNLASYLI